MVVNQQFDEYLPNWIDSRILLNELQDETEILQFGFEDEDDFLEHRMDVPQPSAWNEHPSKNATGLYKFSSIEFNLDLRVRIINRQTYDILSWLGDLGGLVDALYYVTQALMIPYTSYALRSSLLRMLFRLQPSD